MMSNNVRSNKENGGVLCLKEAANINEEQVVENLEDFDIYRLDYETDDEQRSGPKRILAAGGEILQPGDHIYMWCTLYQHHGIVLSTDETADIPSVLIAEFTNVALLHANTFITSSSTSALATSGSGVTGGFRFVKEKEPLKWHKVKYQANPVQCVTWRPGTCSAARPCDTQKVLLRVQFLHDCRHLLPEYHLLASNCENVAVWCVTGKWETLQYQQSMKLSKVGAIASVGLMPVIPGFGMVATVLAFWHSNHIQTKWEEIANSLSKEFQWYAMGRMPKLMFQES